MNYKTQKQTSKEKNASAFSYESNRGNFKFSEAERREEKNHFI